MAATFFWHDYETFGRDPAMDRPAQFAGIRTDAELNELGEPCAFHCRPPEDYLPHPEACLITGITPQFARERGLAECEFAARIHAELARPGTCSVGYNSIRFDDEFTRHLLFRNFHDPYAREWTHGNTRWDLIDVLRLARLLRPEGLQWPDREDGRPSFRLQDLTRANGIAHGAAHDALADARATLELARRLRAAQPRLWEHALKARDKHWVLEQLPLRPELRRPVLHISSRFPSEQGCAALVLPLAAHPVNRNSIISCNLLLDPAPLLEQDAATLRRHLYTRTEDLPPGVARVPLKEIHINRSPMLAPLSVLAPQTAARYGIDVAACHANAERLNAAPGLAAKLREIFTGTTGRAPCDPEADLYGAFLADADRRLLDAVRVADPATLGTRRFAFADARLPELLFRYRARNFAGSLTPAEQERWREHCALRLHGEPPGEQLDCARFQVAIAEARARHATETAKLALLDELDAYGRDLCGAVRPSPPAPLPHAGEGGRRPGEGGRRTGEGSESA